MLSSPSGEIAPAYSTFVAIYYPNKSVHGAIEDEDCQREYLAFDLLYDAAKMGWSCSRYGGRYDLRTVQASLQWMDG
jgi:hypothetical protein